jgi:hypothetical protein
MDRRDLCKIGLAGIGTIVFSKPVSAMENYFKTSAKKTWAVVYGSKCGSTKQGANWINEGLGGIADVVDVTTNPKVSDYEYCVIGGWINAGQLIGTVKTYVTSNKAALKDKIRGLFTVCGNGGKTTLTDGTIKNYLTSQIVQSSGVTDKPVKLFLGKSDPACNGMSMTYDNLKQEEFVTFGKTILTTATNSIRSALPQRFELHQNSPNPFNPVTTISYSLPTAGNVLLTVSALNGRKIATLVSGHQAEGNYKVLWDGSRLAPGYYLYQLEAGGLKQTRTARRVSH